MPDLTTLSNVKNWQGSLAVANTTADALLSGLITSTSADFMRACQRLDLMSANYTESRIGDGASRMIMRHWPVTAIALLMVNSIPVPAQTLSTAGWFIDEGADPERQYVLYLSNGNFTDAAVVQLTYTAGYVEVPDDIEQAVTEWVVYRYTKKSSTAQTQSRGVEGERSEFEEEAIPLNTQRVIEAYTRKYPSYGKEMGNAGAAAQQGGDRIVSPARGRGGRPA